MNRREFIKTAGVMTLGLMLDGQLTEATPKMKISAVKLYDGGFMMKSFACGGVCPKVRLKRKNFAPVCKISLSIRARKLFWLTLVFPPKKLFLLPKIP